MSSSATTSAAAPEGASPFRPGSATLEESQRRAAFSLHLTYLLLAIGVLVASAILHINSQGLVATPFGSSGMPGLCLFRRFAGVDCPGCGLTRCFVSAAHGDLAAAWNFHPAGMLFFVIVLAQIPYRGWQLWQVHRGRTEFHFAWASWIAISLAALMIGQWVVRLLLW